MKVVRISVWVDVDDHVHPEEVLHWVDHCLEYEQKLPLEFDRYETRIANVLLDAPIHDQGE